MVSKTEFELLKKDVSYMRITLDEVKDEVVGTDIKRGIRGEILYTKGFIKALGVLSAFMVVVIGWIISLITKKP